MDKNTEVDTMHRILQSTEPIRNHDRGRNLSEFNFRNNNVNVYSQMKQSPVIVRSRREVHGRGGFY